MSTAEIRRAVYDRQHGECLWCSKFVTFQQAHMHEVVPRGRQGKISLDNSIILCAECHLDFAHGNRKPQFSKKVLDKDSETR